jgi:anti-sigma regulatory factor (Ser/Thr protein kinase)
VTASIDRTRHRRRVLEHSAFFYQDVPHYTAVISSFVRRAVAADDPVLVAVPGPRSDLLRDELDDVAGQVTFIDMAVAGRNPGRIIPAILLAFAAGHPDRRVRIVNEPVWPGRTRQEYPACMVHESLINTVMAQRDVTMLCPYDAERLGHQVLEDAGRTHPILDQHNGRRRSTSYADPLRTAAEFNLPLSTPPGDARAVSYDHEYALSAVRRFVAAQCAAAGLAPDRVDDLVLAANELTANTFSHTDGGGRLTMWTEQGVLICQIDDRGRLSDPTAGYVPPSAEAEGGRGLLLAHELCDLVRVHTGPAGTSIRLHMDTTPIRTRAYW